MSSYLKLCHLEFQSRFDLLITVTVHKDTGRPGWNWQFYCRELDRAYKRSDLCSESGISTHRFRGHSPEGCRILFLLVSAEGHRDYLGSCHLPDIALPGPGSHPGSSWSTVWQQRGGQLTQQPISSPHQRRGGGAERHPVSPETRGHLSASVSS